MALLNTNVGPERVQVFAQPIGNVSIPGAGLSSAAILISTSMVGAPENAPTSVFNMEEFTDTFGGPEEAGAGYYAVKGFFDNAGTGSEAIIVNVGDAATAADYIGNASDGTGLRALDSLDGLGMVMAPGLSLADARLVQTALIDYVETIRAEFGSTISTAFSLAAIPAEITTSIVDKTVLTAQIISITGSGPYVIKINLEDDAVAATGIYTVVDYSQLSGETVTVGGTVLTEGVDWTASVSNASTATSLAAAISGLASVNAVAAGAIVTVTAADPGLAGNSIGTLTSDAVNLTVGGATLSGGADGAVDLSDVTPGMIVTDVAGTEIFAISAVSDVNDTVTVTVNPNAELAAGDDMLIKIPSAVTYKDIVINNPSKTHAWYYNHVVVLDEAEDAEVGDTLVQDPVGHVAGIIARIDGQRAIGGHSHAPAGIRYAGISGIQGLNLSLSEKKDGEALRLNFINRLTSFPGSGNVVYGGYTADSGEAPVFTADEQLIQVMRTIQFIKASLEPGLRAFIWENFSPDTKSQISTAIASFLRNNIHLFPAGLPESSKFKVIPVEETQDELDKGLLRVRVQVRPNKAIRFVEVALEFPLPTA